MGTLHYGSPDDAIVIDDFTLAHLKAIAVLKLRRNESFAISWLHPGSPPGRSTIWLHPAIPLRFTFDEAIPAELDTRWMQQLNEAANSNRGIQLAAERIAPRASHA